MSNPTDRGSAADVPAGHSGPEARWRHAGTESRADTGASTTPPPPPAAPHRGPGPIERFFGGNPLAVLVRLALLSVIIGVILAVLGFDPRRLVDTLLELVDAVIHNSAELVESIVRYFLLGAAIVFPVWLVVRLLKSTTRR
jgi:hypothetical protein